ncbi:MAG: hypothetical protein JWP35_316 [Caulobacter sp.]|nr:hypothetical protein [Caulobacter sp.]
MSKPAVAAAVIGLMLLASPCAAMTVVHVASDSSLGFRLADPDEATEGHSGGPRERMARGAARAPMLDAEQWTVDPVQPPAGPFAIATGDAPSALTDARTSDRYDPLARSATTGAELFSHH